MATIIVGYGSGDRVVESEKLDTEGSDRFSVRVGDTSGTLYVKVPDKTRIYATGFWKYVDIDDASPAADTDADVSAE